MLPELANEEAVTSSMLFPDSRPKASECYAAWLRPQDIHFTLGGVVHTEADVQYKLSFVRSAADGPFGEDDVTLVRGVLPHIKATIRVADNAAVSETIAVALRPAR